MTNQDAKKKFIEKLREGVMPYGYIKGQSYMMTQSELGDIIAELVFQIAEHCSLEQTERIYYKTAEELMDDGFLKG